MPTLSFTSSTTSSITVNWTEEVADGRYYVYLNGVLVRRTFGFGCTLRGLTANTAYNIEVRHKSHFGIELSTSGVQSYSTAATLIPAISGDIYYIDAASGNDTNDGSIGSPWASLYHACQQTYTQGAKFKIMPGTYVEQDMCYIPEEVDYVQGSGEANTIIKLNVAAHNQDTSAYQLDSFVIRSGWEGTHTPGITIEHLTIDGESTTRHPDSPTKNGAWGGLFLYRTNNSIVRHITVKNTYFTGIWDWWGISGTIHDCTLENAGWVDPGGNYLSGAMNLSKITNYLIYNNSFTEAYGKGRGPRSIGAGDGVFTNVHIFESTFNIDPFAAWQGFTAPNMDFEFWDEMWYGVYIYENECDNTISVVNKPSAPTDVQHDCRILSNRIIIQDITGYPLEASVSGYELAGNIIYVGANSGQVSSDWEPRSYDLEFDRWHAHHNYIHGLTGGYPSTVHRFRNQCTNVRIEFNTYEFTADNPHNFLFVDTNAETVTGVCENNILIRTTALNVQSEDYPKADAIFGAENYPGEPVGNYAVTFNNNIFVSFPSTGTNVITTNPAFLLTGGDRNDAEAYYAIDETSPAWNASSDASNPNIGAFQFLEAIVGGNVGPTALFSAAPTSGEAPLTVAFTDASSDPDGTIASRSWDFGDGSPLGTGTTPTHEYTSAGTYTVTLTVTDNDGATDTHQVVITVSAVPVVVEKKAIVSGGKMIVIGGKMVVI